MKCPHCNGNIDIRFIKAPADATAKPSRTTAAPSDELEELLDAINESSLEGQSADFVSDMRARFKKYGERTMVSEKQITWLRSLANPKEELL